MMGHDVGMWRLMQPITNEGHIRGPISYMRIWKSELDSAQRNEARYGNYKFAADKLKCFSLVKTSYEKAKKLCGEYDFGSLEQELDEAAEEFKTTHRRLCYYLYDLGGIKDRKVRRIEK